MEVIEKIIEIMQAKGITAYKLCKDLEMSQQTFSNWKKGTELPTSRLKSIITYLGVTPNEVFGIDTSKELLTDTEKELLEIFNRMDETHQLRAIGILEDYADKHPAEQESKIISTCKTG